MIESLWTLIHYTVKEQIRHRVFLSLVLFGFILIGGGAVISSLAVEEHAQMLMDLGLAGIEFLGLTTIVFSTVNLVLSEIDNRTIYLLLSRPLPRWEYILGRFLGTTMTVAIAMAIMACMHILLLRVYGGSWASASYLVAWSCSLAKLAVVGSLALLLSLLTTSPASAMSFTLFFWVMGHFSEELRFLAQKSANPIFQAALWCFYNLAPNFSYFNYRDFLLASRQPPWAWFASLATYAFCYAGTCLWISTFLISEAEF